MPIRSTYSAIPSVEVLIKNISDTIFGKKINRNIADPWLKSNDKYIWLSKTTYSLALIAKLRKDKFKRKIVNIFVPDFFCNTALSLLREDYIHLYFYNINKSLEPDQNSLKELLSNIKPDIILQVHYFGKEYETKNIANICKKYNCWFIEDATHVLIPYGSIGCRGDFVLYSPYKHFPIPDGALLVFHRERNQIPKNNNLDLIFDNINKINKNIVKKKRLIYLIKWVIKKLIQAILKTTKKHFYTQPVKEIGYFITYGHNISRLSLNILNKEIAEIEDIIKYKQILASRLNLPLINQGNKISVIDEEIIPYMIRYDPELSKQKIKEYLIKNKNLWSNLPYIFWPDLAPEVLNDYSSYLHANEIASTSLFIPIHKSINKINIDRFIKISSLK